jgi:hypothetical protein
MKLVYCVLTFKKGLLRKKTKKVHLFFLPVSFTNYFYIALIGKLSDEENSYVSQLMVSFPAELLEEVIKGKQEYFGERFSVVEELQCIPLKKNNNTTKIVVSGKKQALVVKSNILLTFDDFLTTGSKKIYILRGKLDLDIGEVVPQKSVVSKLALIQRMYLR